MVEVNLILDENPRLKDFLEVLVMRYFENTPTFHFNSFKFNTYLV